MPTLGIRWTTRRMITATPIRLQQPVEEEHEQPVITFIGGGNMAEAMLGGLDASGYCKLRYIEPLKRRLEYMQDKYPNILGLTDEKDQQTEALHDADVVVLAVKPPQVRQVMPMVTSCSLSLPLIVSIVGGVTTHQIISWMNIQQGSTTIPPVVRCMPNTPALLGEGALGLYANTSVTLQQRDLTERIMRAVAKEILWVEKESMMNAVTGISGSGPAYFFLLMESMQNAGVAAGLTVEEATRLTIQTCLGAARMAQLGHDDLATLRRKVTSPNGTTEAAIQSLEANQIRQVMKDAVFAATSRAEQLSNELD
ncbi:pyrroline-5-carboxylate reductase [Halteromyces radiatus]|uniref:pyrroline-5-carboxylate reductase n=1 Tax=Halteromyces radiatus TaxID=101107 RepID=UPI00221EF20F|nr:pyrroline-5-carboxylate reductase [Halteromyces radiatus]KAI8097741.1 pyrroline-5-carboxylate reductase [Halteromyces radiatus]